MNTVRALLATEALLLLSWCVYGVLLPEAVVHTFTGAFASPEAASAVAWACGLGATVGLAQLLMMDPPDGRAFRTFVQARFASDLLCLLAVLIHPEAGPRMLLLVSLLLVFTATRFYALLLGTHFEEEPVSEAG